jgi:hypothetical protein
MKYYNFDLDVFNFIQTENEDQFSVRVANSPAGEQLIGEAEKVALPLKVRIEVGALRRRELSKSEIIMLGKELGNALFPPSVRSLLSKSLHCLGSNEEGLRIRLKLDTYNLAILPWEYVYIPDLGPAGFLSLNRRLSVVRYESQEGALVPVSADVSPIRMVVILASPDDPNYTKIDVATEKNSIEKALENISEIKAEYDTIATVDTLLSSFSSGKSAHIFHFAGHGEFKGDMGEVYGSEQGAGEVILLDSNRRAKPLSADQLAVILNAHGVRVAVLTACEVGQCDTSSVWAGVVTALTHSGIPAVVGMQFGILDTNAVEFSKAFYKAIAYGQPIEAAVADGRIAIFSFADDDERDWGVPVLYLRAENGVLFPKEGKPEASQVNVNAISEELKNLLFEKDDYKYMISGTKVKIVEYTGADSAITVPTAISYDGNTYTVTSICEDAFRDKESLTSISIVNSVASIGQNAFKNCSNLKKVSIAESVASIGNWAFSGCSSLKAIEVSSGNTEYSSEDGILYDKSKTTLICYPAGKPSSSYTVPDSVTLIVNWAFSGCSNLKAIEVSSGNTEYSSEDGILYDKSKTTLICYPAGKPNSSYIVPGSVIIIVNWAFSGYANLKNVCIPNSVTNIGNLAFSYCSNLNAIEVSDGNTEYSSEGGILYDKAKTTLICYPAEKTGASFTVPESVTSIGEWAFAGCDNLTDVIIPENVTSIGWGAFYQCSSMIEARFSGDAPHIGGDFFGNAPNNEYQVFYRCHPEFKVKYIEGKVGFTNPWYGQPTEPISKPAEAPQINFEAGKDGYIIPGSNSKYLTDKDISSFTINQLAFARNEIYARHGYVFKKQIYKDYFSSKSWYTPDLSFKGNYNDLNKYEKYNVTLIQKYENK